MRISVDRIKEAVAAEFQIPLREMTSDRRYREVVRPRQVAMALACQLTPCSVPTIGRVFGGRDHTTVLHARRQVARLRAADVDFDKRVARLHDELAGPISPPPQIQLEFLTGPLFDWADRRAAG